MILKIFATLCLVYLTHGIMLTFKMMDFMSPQRGIDAVRVMVLVATAVVLSGIWL